MANKFFFQPVRMESQFVDTKLQTVICQKSGADVAVTDGALFVLDTKFAVDPVYKNAFTNAGKASEAPVDVNCRIAKEYTAATEAIGVIDLAVVGTAEGQGNTYRVGYKTIGLTEEAGVPVRFRVLELNDTFVTGRENCTGDLTVGQYAVPSTTTVGSWEAATDSSAAGLCCLVVDEYVVSQGVDGNVTSGNGVKAYVLCVVKK